MSEKLSNGRIFSENFITKTTGCCLCKPKQSYCFNLIKLKGKRLGLIADRRFRAPVAFDTAFSSWRCAGAIHPFIEHDKIIAYHFRGKFAIALLIIPAAGAQPAFNVDQAALV